MRSNLSLAVGPFFVLWFARHVLNHMRIFLFLALCFMSSTAMNTNIATAPKTTPSSAQSQELNSLNSEKTSLQKRISSLRSQEDTWHSAYLGTAIFAGILALFSWLFQHLESKNVLRERPLNERISFIEERIRAIDKDVADAALGENWKQAKLADARAGEANKEAGRANERASGLENEAAEERKRASDLEKEAARIRQDNLATETRLNEANRTLEAERTINNELQFSLAPRELWVTYFLDNTSSLDELKSLDGINIIVESVPDFEARRAAGSLVKALQTAHLWVVRTELISDPIPETLFDGVTVERSSAKIGLNNPSDPDEQKRIEAWRKRADAVESLTNFLEKNGWVAREGWAMPEELPDEQNTIRIRVGFKPSTLSPVNSSDYEENDIQKSIQKMIEYQNTLLPNGRYRTLMRGPFPLPPLPKK